jgi:hypothetical protein
MFLFISPGRPRHSSGSKRLASHSGDPDSILSQVIWHLWWIKVHWGAVYACTSDSRASYHPAYFPVFLIGSIVDCVCSADAHSATNKKVKWTPLRGVSRGVWGSERQAWGCSVMRQYDDRVWGAGYVSWSRMQHAWRPTSSLAIDSCLLRAWNVITFHSLFHSCFAMLLYPDTCG